MCASDLIVSALMVSFGSKAATVNLSAARVADPSRVPISPLERFVAMGTAHKSLDRPVEDDVEMCRINFVRARSISPAANYMLVAGASQCVFRCFKPSITISFMRTLAPICKLPFLVQGKLIGLAVR